MHDSMTHDTWWDSCHRGPYDLNNDGYMILAAGGDEPDVDRAARRVLGRERRHPAGRHGQSAVPRCRDQHYLYIISTLNCVN